MVRSLDAATQTAVRDKSRLWRANLVLVTAKDMVTGDPVLFGFTDYGDNITLNIVDAVTGGTVSRSYIGDNAPILSIDPMPYKVGLEVDTTQVVLNPLHPQVELMARGHDIRNAPVQIHRAWLDEGGTPVAAPRARRVGQVNGAPFETGAVGGQSRLVLRIVSHTRELTRTSLLRWSDESQRQRSDDRFMRYTGISEDVPVWWGEEAKRD